MTLVERLDAVVDELREDLDAATTTRTAGRGLLALSVYITLLHSAAVAGPVAASTWQDRAEIADSAVETAKERNAGIWVSRGVGGSMQPTLGPGDLALCTDRVEPEVGDIVVVEAGVLSDRPVRHRVVDLDDDHVVTKGDANRLPDPAVDRGDLKCSVVWHEGRAAT